MLRYSLSVGIIFIAYAIQAHFRPFMDQLDLDMSEFQEHVQTDGAVLNYVRGRVDCVPVYPCRRCASLVNHTATPVASMTGCHWQCHLGPVQLSMMGVY
jgi:hypothetical protein